MSKTDSNILEFITTAHAAGRKKVLFPGTGSPLTQFAFGRLEGGERVPLHRHESMDEYFYFIEGTGEYQIATEREAITPGVAVYIPAKADHELRAFSALEFVYFGIARDNA